MVQRKLNPEVREWADKIYNLDRRKYRKLIIWIRAASRTYSTDVIVETLKIFYRYENRTGKEWWAYMDKALDQMEGKINALNAESESARHKEEARELGAMFRGDRLGEKQK